ncbi:hypothetical protein EDD21DRAFT_401548 [Dissophora ornata]|nr:hypothetical protein BGZ58_000494 [Dissophora ornata]KAI8605075.1 hypothetical protein EDD21DRAFT_401548 [Dissophora ornata]
MSALITINVKASNDQKYVISIAVSETVLDLKGMVAAKCDTPPERMRLIYSGRVLKDNDTLETYKITDGHTVHMVRSAVAAPAATGMTSPAVTSTTPSSASETPATTPAATTSATTRDTTAASTAAALPNPWANLTGGGGMGGMGGFGGIGAMGGMGGGDGMMPAMMSQMMQDPNFAQYMSSMLQNPRVLESMISMNPALQSMGPEVRQLLSSPQFQRMASNPDALRQVAQVGSQLGGGIGGMGGMGTFGGAGAGMYNPWTSATPASMPATSASTTTATPSAAGTTPTPASNPFSAFGGSGATANPMADYWAQQMAAMGGRATASTPGQIQTQQPPEEMFQVQLKQLNDMGFWDAAKNIRALLAARGNVNGAIEILFSSAV